MENALRHQPVREVPESTGAHTNLADQNVRPGIWD